MKLIQSNLIQPSHIKTVYGKVSYVYADYTASGRSLKFIEDYISKKVLPLYANTHTSVSLSGKHTNHLRESAREAVRSVTRCNESDLVIFVGSGTTGAVNLLVNKMKIKEQVENSKNSRSNK